MEVTNKIRIVWVVIIGVWIIATVVSVPFSREFFENTSSDVLSCASTKTSCTISNEAQKAFSEAFPKYSQARVIFIIAKTSSTSNLTLTKAYLLSIAESIKSSIKQAGLESKLFFLLSQPQVAGNFIGQLFISSDSHTGILCAVVNASSGTHDFEQLEKYLSSEVKSYDTQNESFTISVTSYHSLLEGSKEAARFDSMLVWFISTPIAILVSALLLKASVFIPLFAICSASTMLISASLSNLIATAWQPQTSYGPQLLECLVGLTTVWFSFIVLRRFTERLDHGYDSKQAALQTLILSLRPVGLIWASMIPASLATSCTSTVASPYAVLLTLGITLSALVSLFVVTAILGSVGSFFAIPGIIPCMDKCRQRAMLSSIEEANFLRGSFLVFFYIKIASRLWRASVIIIAGMVLLSPFVILAAKTQIVPDTSELFSSNTESASAYDDLISAFPASLVAPYILLHTGKGTGNTSVFSEEDFTYNLEYLQRALNSLTNLPSVNVLSLYYVAGYRVTWSSAINFLYNLTPPGDMTRSYRELSSFLVNKNKTIAVSFIFPKEDPASVSDTFVPGLRSLADLLSSETGHKVQVFGTPVDLYDAMSSEMLQLLWATIATVIGFIIATSAISQAPFVFLRILIPGVLVFVAAFGFDVTALQDDFSWVVVVLAFPSLIGISLSFEMDIYSKMTEIRSSGFDKNSSVIRGLYSGKESAVAGPLLVIVYFIPLLFSRAEPISDIALIHIILSIFDLFVVRFFMSPALSLLWGDLNWWPFRQAVIYTHVTSAIEDSQFLKPLLAKVQKIVNAS